MSEAGSVFDKAERTLVALRDLDTNPRVTVAGRLDSEILPIRSGPEHDDKYFESMSFVVFFSGFRAMGMDEDAPATRASLEVVRS